MKRLRTKVVASIVAVLILFCSLPMGSVTALTVDTTDMSITFKGDESITYRDADGNSFDDIAKEESAEDIYGFSVEKLEESGDYKISFGNEYESSFQFEVEPVGDITVSQVVAQYKNMEEWTKLSYNSLTRIAKFPISAAAKNKDKGFNFIVKVEVVNPTYTVYAPSAVTGYTFSVDSEYDDMKSHNDGTFKFSITSLPGYTKPNVSVSSGGTLEKNTQQENLDENTKYNYTINSITKDVTINYTGAKKTYQVTLPTLDGYYVTSSSGGSTIEYGGYFDFNVTPKSGYKSIELTNISTSSGEIEQINTNQYRLSGVTDKDAENVTITINGAGRQTYTINKPDDVTGYTVAPNTQEEWVSKEDGSFEFSITADDGYHPPVVRRDGSTIISTGSTNVENKTKYTYKLENINQTTTITFTGSKKTYKVKFAEEITGYNLYSASSDNSTTVEHGNSFSFYVVPKDGYKAVTESNITVQNTNTLGAANCTVRSLGNNQYQLRNVTENVTISVNGAEQTYTITLPSSKTEYSVSVDSQDDVSEQNGSYTIKHNKSFSFKVTLNEGYTASSIVVSANNKELSADEGSFGDNTKQYTISNITADQTITISGVTKNVYSVEYASVGKGYTLTTTDPTSLVSHGTKLKFTLTLKDGYKADSTPTVNATGASVEDVQITKQSDTVYSVTVTVKNNITALTVGGITEKKYKVEFESETGFIVSNENGERENIAHGATYSFKVCAKSGYRLVSVAVSTKGENDKTPLNPIDDTYYINNINTDKTITVILDKVTLTVTYNDSLNEDNPNVQVKYTVDGVTVDGNGDNNLYGTVDAATGIVTFPEKPTNDYSEYYDFDGWFNGSNKQDETLSLGNADASLTLTAKWTPDWNKIFTLKWDPNANKNEGGSLTIKYTPDKQNLVPDLEGAQITKVGMYYANQKSNLENKNEELKKYFVDSDKIQNTRSVRQIITNDNKSVILYVYVTDYADIKAWTSFEQGFTNVKTDRYAVGWIELTLQDGSKQYIYTDLKTINANQE